jgi:Ca2+-binding EF-hand superfamily protein
MIASFLRSAETRAGATVLLIAVLSAGCAVAPSVGTLPPSARTTVDEAIALFSSWDKNRNAVLEGAEFPYSDRLYAYLTETAGGELNLNDFVALYGQYQRKVEELLNERFGWFKLYDKDGDGRLSEDEARRLPNQIAMQTRFDANRDGTLTIDEVERMSAAPQRWRALLQALDMAQDFLKWDRNKDGVLDANELERERYLIPLLDRNGDGRLQFDEVAAAKMFVSEGPEAFDRYALEVRFNNLDANGDGRLSGTELAKYERLTRWLDQDKNGVISKEEFMMLYAVLKTRLRPVSSFEARRKPPQQE